MLKILAFIILPLLHSCFNKDSKPEVWIYTSLYKDTIAEMTPKLNEAFPDVKINWYQAGSEDVAAKVNTELMAGEPNADLLISSERFWYQELSDTGKLHSFKPVAYEHFYDDLKNKDGTFHIASIPVMIIAYNNEVISEKEAPKTFLDLADPRYKDKVSGGSPLASGTSFTTVVALQKKYGWDYISNLKKNNFLFEGGNSAVIRRIQNKERPIGWVLLENVLRFKKDDARLQVVYPTDGAITQFNTLAILKKAASRDIVEKIANWIFSDAGQQTMLGSYMYSPIKNFKSPEGALSFKELKAKSFPWNNDVIKEITINRNELKEKFSNIVFK